MIHRQRPDDEGFRSPGDIGQGSRFAGGYTESRIPLADASYPGYGAYATLDGSRVDTGEYADIDWPGRDLDPERDTSQRAARDFTGIGPRGYRRPDASIHEDLCERLTRAQGLDLGDVEVLVAGGEVVLTGTVDDRTTRRRVEDIAYRVTGVLDVNNKLRIGTVIHAPRPDISADDLDLR